MMIFRTHQPLARGLTLLELVIAMSVVALLASIAYPASTEHLRKSRRAEAQQVLMDIALRQQQLMLDTRAYATSLAATGATLPPSVSTHYRVEVTATGGTTPTFTATATPLAGQAADTCGALSVTDANVREPARCW